MFTIGLYALTHCLRSILYLDQREFKYASPKSAFSKVRCPLDNSEGRTCCLKFHSQQGGKLDIGELPQSRNTPFGKASLKFLKEIN